MKSTELSILVGSSLVIALMLTMFVAEGAFSEEGVCPPPSLPSNNQWAKVPATLKKSPVSKILMGDFVVELERTTLEDLRAASGVGKVRHRGDAAGIEYWLCYSGSARGMPLRMWMSSGEMGANQAILSVILKAGGHATRNCPQLPSKLGDISFENSLRIGSSVRELYSLFGQPSAKFGNWWVYSFAGKIRAQHQGRTEDFDVTAGLEAEVKGGRIVTLSESQVTSD